MRSGGCIGEQLWYSKSEKDLDFTYTDPEVFLETVTTNLQSVFLMGQAAARVMAGQGGGTQYPVQRCLAGDDSNGVGGEEPEPGIS